MVLERSDISIELARTLGWLAAEGDEVLALPRVRAKIDTLALDYFYAREPVYRKHRADIGPAGVRALEALDELLKARAGAPHASFWTAEALRGDAGWAEIKDAARAALSVLDNPVMSWWPTLVGTVEANVADGLAACPPEQRAMYERHAIPITRFPIERSGLEPAFVILRAFGRVVFWDDVEEGFEWATPDAEGVLCDYGASQSELGQILWQMVEDDAE